MASKKTTCLWIMLNYSTIFFFPKYCVNIKISALPARMASIIPNGSIVNIVAKAIEQVIIENAKPHILFLNNAMPAISLKIPQTTPAKTISADGGSKGINSP